MPRKGENIYKRKDGRWEGRYIKGRRPDGRAVYGSVYGKKYSEVKDRLIPLKSTYAARKHAKAVFSGPLRDWLSYWLEELEKPYIKPSTYVSYRGKIQRYILPVLGDRQMERLTQEDIQNWIDELQAGGLSGSSIKVIYRIISAALQKAVYKHCLLVNPCQDIHLPGMELPGIKVLSVAQQKELEKHAFKSKGNEAVIIALYTGMRIGEISGLTWNDIDFENDLIYVRRTLQRITDYNTNGAKTKIIMDLPKTDMSYRIIPFSAHLKGYLLEWKALSNSDYVVSCKGHYAEPRVISYRFRRVADKAGLTGITFHRLRHSYATRCVEHGIDIATVSRLLGHSSIKMTLDTYAESTMEQRKSAMMVLDMFLRKDASG